MNLSSTMSTTNSYNIKANHHYRNDTLDGGVTQRASSSVMSEASMASTQPPPFFLYSATPTKPNHSVYTTTTTAAATTATTAGDNRGVSRPSCSFSSSGRMASYPLAVSGPTTPPPSRAPRHFGYTRTIVSPPAPLRVHNSCLNYERIGPAHLQIYRLVLPPLLLGQLDPIVALAEDFAYQLQNGWHTDLYSLTKQDIALRDIPGMSRKISPIFDHLCHAIRTLYGAQKVVVDKNQPHILKYSVDSGHTGVELHHDRCDVTANLALSRSGDYCGGGTYIPDTGSIIKLNHGECLLHPGSLVHGGMEVTKGTRYLMVTFAHLR